MPHTFDADVVAAVLRHMNGDHADDNLLIARAFAEPDAEGDAEGDVEGGGDGISDAVMTGFDGDGGVWRITRGGTASDLFVPWPGGPISDRPSVRHEVVAIHDLACARLGVEPRPH
ncbi:DUF2470 domain-containing protein [Microbacterium sp. SD291]|uniref:DUF2470 domain-containing protein n=1 Tax=Microbacterium sp. SD291 TaxID=2782007 RepID=UPI001A957DC9|nr:DUF2470 domain-containing protein [Microbacterium sp. SD291]MBO0980240.1 DUF2470 domain-containing protein [Microbacterium sp. SD291]